MKMKVDKIELYYETRGETDRQSMVFIHGLMDDCSVWSSQIEHFSERYNTIAYDHRGHGRSDKPDGDYSMQTLSNDLHALIEKLGLNDVILVGHSMGGVTALTYTLDHPDKVSKLVLVDPGALAGPIGRMVGLIGKMPIYDRLLSLTFPLIPHELLVMVMPILKHYRPSREVLEDTMARARNTPKYASHNCLKELMEHDISGRLAKINIPTLIISGERDMLKMLFPYLNREIKDSMLQIIPDAAHSPMMDKPEECSRIIEEFLERSSIFHPDTLHTSS